ncbi:MAG: hypothetical protein WCF77_05005 [Minisyncoccia bacterium]
MRETINLKGDEEEYQAEPQLPRRGKKIFVAAVAVLVILAGWWFVNGATQWKAVFLTNNQVYFGHFWDVPFEGTITLRNVYYLQFSQPNQQLDTQDVSQLKLVKLGSEIHGPTDEMVIPMSQVLFWETLRSNSAIVTTIKNGK